MSCWFRILTYVKIKENNITSSFSRRRRGMLKRLIPNFKKSFIEVHLLKYRSTGLGCHFLYSQYWARKEQDVYCYFISLFYFLVFSLYWNSYFNYLWIYLLSQVFSFIWDQIIQFWFYWMFTNYKPKIKFTFDFLKQFNICIKWRSLFGVYYHTFKD